MYNGDTPAARLFTTDLPVHKLIGRTIGSSICTLVNQKSNTTQEGVRTILFNLTGLGLFMTYFRCTDLYFLIK